MPSFGHPRLDSAFGTLESAILQAVAYADVFDYPLTLRQAHRYLAGVSASLSGVRRALDNGLLKQHQLVCERGYLTLPGRESIVETRLQRQEFSALLWRKGMRYGLAIASLPFVRMVAVTGTLAVNNVEPGADIDYLIVTEPGRVWLTRLLVLVVVYLGRLEGVTICPNYVISTNVLGQFDHSFFTAHEFVQMVPLYGLAVYRDILAANDWVQRFLPNAFTDQWDIPREHSLGPARRALKRWGEAILAGRLGDFWERRESQLKISRLREQAADCGTGAASFGPECCKGHLDDHGGRIREAYAQRLCQVGLKAESAAVSSVFAYVSSAAGRGEGE
jgi:hypothetical protein